MKDNNAIEKLKNQLNLLHVLGRWTASMITERLNKDRHHGREYKAVFAEEENPVTTVSSEILITRNHPHPLIGFDFAHPLAIIATSFTAGDKPVVRVYWDGVGLIEWAEKDEYTRFLKVMKQIAEEMLVPFTVEKQ